MCRLPAARTGGAGGEVVNRAGLTRTELRAIGSELGESVDGLERIMDGLPLPELEPLLAELGAAVARLESARQLVRELVPYVPASDAAGAIAEAGS